MVDSRDKGARAELTIRNTLRELTSLNWERTPGSGALNEKHGLKGDLYVPNEKNIFCVEVKHYAEDHLTSKVITSKSPQLLDWWDQAIRQALQVNRKPLLIFKHDRSKVFAAFMDIPENDYIYIYINRHSTHPFYVCLLEDWIKNDKPKFIE